MNGPQKIRELFATKKTIIAPGAHDMLTAKIIGKLGFDAVYMTGYGQSASHLGKPDDHERDGRPCRQYGGVLWRARRG